MIIIKAHTHTQPVAGLTALKPIWQASGCSGRLNAMNSSNEVDDDDDDRDNQPEWQWNFY